MHCVEIGEKLTKPNNYTCARGVFGDLKSRKESKKKIESKRAGIKTYAHLFSSRVQKHRIVLRIIKLKIIDFSYIRG